VEASAPFVPPLIRGRRGQGGVRPDVGAPTFSDRATGGGLDMAGTMALALLDIEDYLARSFP